MHIFLFVSRLAHKGQGRQSQNLETSTDGMKTKINFVNSLKHDINLVQNIVEENKSIDSVVDNFSTFITDRAKPFFKKSSKLTRKIYLYVQILYTESLKKKKKHCRRPLEILICRKTSKITGKVCM